jgi:molybdate transport repressor ModE-like protein/molybdopterin-binding protein
VTRRAGYITPLDLALLTAVARVGSVVAAARATGIDRNRAVYRLRRLDQILGARVLQAARGGARHGGSRLTDVGWATVRQGSEVAPVARPPVSRSPRALLEGTWHARPFPHVDLSRGLTLAVGFRATEGEPVRLALDPESVLVARRRFPTSARNVIEGIVERIRPSLTPGVVRVETKVAGRSISALLTREAIRSLGLGPRRRVVLYIKATAIRRIGVSGRRTSARRG